MSSSSITNCGAVSPSSLIGNSLTSGVLVGGVLLVQNTSSSKVESPSSESDPISNTTGMTLPRTLKQLRTSLVVLLSGIYPVGENDSLDKDDERRVEGGEGNA
jgi:hypothetical protein